MSQTNVVWSYSSLSLFQQCPKKYYHLRVVKDIKEPESEQMRYGLELHKAAEDYVKSDTPLPEHFAFMQPVLEKLKALPGEKHCEYKMGLTRSLEPCGFFDKGVWWRGIADLLVIDGDTARVLDYKGLAVDTEIPTPSGFVRMSDLKVGGYVFGVDGLPYKIIGKSQTKDIPCYKVMFTNKLEVVCDEEHLWQLTDGRVLNVKELQPRHRIPLTAPVQYEQKLLPIDPYVLGLWLADGKHSSSEISKPDAFIWEEIQRRGYQLGADTGTSCSTRTVKGIRRHLHQLELYKNKHIPSVYKQASVPQRIDLLRGLLDGDGYANPIRKQAVFQSTNKCLSNDVVELVESLGLRASQADVEAKGFGVVTRAYPVSFRPRGFNPFLLPRKAVVASTFFGGREYLEIASVQLTDTVQTQCISVASPDNLYLCTRHYIPTHNTGKDKYADMKQLEVLTLAVFKHFPQVKTVKAGLLFVIHRNFIKETYDKDNEMTMWAKWLPETKRLEAAFENAVWNATPNFTCRGWCPVLSCVHNGKNK